MKESCSASPEDITALGKHFLHDVRGSSTCVLCVHGRPGNSLLMESFAIWCREKSYDCYRYDQFACEHKPNVQIDSARILERLVEELYLHVSKLRYRNLLIVAHSFGAVLLSEMLQDYEFPQQHLKVVLSGFCPEREEFLEANQKRLTNYACEYGETQAEQNFFDKHICRRRSTTPEQLQALQALPMGNIHLRESYLGYLTAIRCPVLITYGSEDICSSYQVTKTQEQLASCRIAQFPGTAHYPFIERPAVYFQELDRFMEAH